MTTGQRPAKQQITKEDQFSIHALLWSVSNQTGFFTIFMAVLVRIDQLNHAMILVRKVMFCMIYLVLEQWLKLSHAKNWPT